MEANGSPVRRIVARLSAGSVVLAIGIALVTAAGAAGHSGPNGEDASGTAMPRMQALRGRLGDADPTTGRIACLDVAPGMGLRLVSALTGRVLKSIGTDVWVRSACMTAGGRAVATADNASRPGDLPATTNVTIWHSKSGQRLARFSEAELGAVIAPFKRRSDSRGRGSIGPARPNAEGRRWEADVVALTASRSAPVVVVATLARGVRVRDIHSGRVLAWAPTIRGPSVRLAVSGNGMVVAATGMIETGRDSPVRILELADPPMWEDMPGSDSRAGGLALSDDGDLVAAPTTDGCLGIWQTIPGRLVLRIPMPDGAPVALAFSPSGRYLVSADGARHIRVWDTASGVVVAAPSDAPEPVRSIAFAHGDTRFAVGGDSSIAVLSLSVAAPASAKTRVPAAAQGGPSKPIGTIPGPAAVLSEVSSSAQFSEVDVAKGWVRQASASLHAAGWMPAYGGGPYARGQMVRLEVAHWVTTAKRREVAAPAPVGLRQQAATARARLALRRLAVGFREELLGLGAEGRLAADVAPLPLPFVRPVPPRCLAAYGRLRAHGLIGHIPTQLARPVAAAPEERTTALRWHLAMALDGVLRAAGAARSPDSRSGTRRAYSESVRDLHLLKTEMLDDLRIAHEDWAAWCGTDLRRGKRHRTPALADAAVRGDADEVRYLLHTVGVPSDMPDSDEGLGVLALATIHRQVHIMRIVAAHSQGARQATPRP